LFHVSDGESSERRIFGEDFNAHGFAGNHSNEASVTRFNEFGEFFEFFTGTSVDLRFDFLEFAGDVGGVTIEDWAVTVSDLTRVVKDNNLS